jgi:DNA polymerase III alpha subunit (gram-positive type)
MNLIIFDLETTGLSPYSHEIIQIAAVKMRVGVWQEEATFETFVRPRSRVPSFITGLTGITQADVAQAPLPGVALNAFSRFVGEGGLLIAHNGGRFDVPFLRESCARHQLSVREAAFVDSCRLSRQLWGGRGGHGLDAVMGRLGLSGDGVRRHDARGDVTLLGRAVSQMWQRLQPDGMGCPVKMSSALIPVLE